MVALLTEQTQLVPLDRGLLLKHTHNELIPDMASKNWVTHTSSNHFTVTHLGDGRLTAGVEGPEDGVAHALQHLQQHLHKRGERRGVTTPLVDGFRFTEV